MNPESQTISVMMPKIVRRILLLQEESFSYIRIRDGRFVFVGRDRVGKEVFCPVSMVGTFDNGLLNNLFLYLANNCQNGILAVTTGPFTKAVLFKRGDICFAGSTDAHDRIGAILGNLGYLTEAQIEEVAAVHDGRRFGVRACDMGFITKDQLWHALKVQVVGICCSLVRFPVGTYFFLPDCVPADAFGRFSFDSTRILFEGMRRLDEENRDFPAERLEGLTPIEILSALEDE